MRVIDASVIVKALAKDEPGHIEAEAMIKKGGRVPEWLFMEIANVLATKTKYTESETKELLDLVYDMGFGIEDVNKKMLKEAMLLSKRCGVAVYDMVYAVLAKELGVKLVTADKNFAAKTGFGWVEVLG